MLKARNGSFYDANMGRYQSHIFRMPFRTFWLVTAFLFYEREERNVYKNHFVRSCEIEKEDLSV